MIGLVRECCGTPANRSSAHAEDCPVITAQRAAYETERESRIDATARAILGKHSVAFASGQMMMDSGNALAAIKEALTLPLPRG